MLFSDWTSHFYLNNQNKWLSKGLSRMVLKMWFSEITTFFNPPSYIDYHLLPYYFRIYNIFNAFLFFVIILFIRFVYRDRFRTRRRASIAPLPALRLNDKEMLASDFDAYSVASNQASITSVNSLASLLREKMQVS